MSWNAYDLNYKILQTSTYNYQTESNVTISDIGSCIIPNQLWKGYYDQEVFNTSVDRPSNLTQFYDFGVSIRNYGCAVCCAIGAINYLYRTSPASQLDPPHTVLEFYNKKCFTWNKQSFNAQGQHNGVTLAYWGNMKQFGVSFDSKHIAYDIGREYAWCKNSSQYKATGTIDVNTWAERFTQPSSTAQGLKTGNYNQAKGSYAPGSLTDLMEGDSQKAYRAGQANAIARVKTEIAQGKLCILYINSPVKKSGHYVLAVRTTNIDTTSNLFSDIIVWDPCPTNQTGYDNKTSYYGREMTLIESMKRLSSDISDGIRSVNTVTKTS